MIRAVSLCLACALGAAASADAPKSAIPWLSDVLERPPELPDAPSPVVLPLETIEVTTLDHKPAGPVGFLAPTLSGIPVEAWSNVSLLRARRLVETAAPKSPSAIQLFHRLLLAETLPPRGDTDGRFLRVRIDRLLSDGALEKASALLEASGIAEPAAFGRWFDAQLLIGRGVEACARLADTPNLSPSRAVSIFCLARNGAWGDADIAYDLALSLETLSPHDADLLAFYLDPGLVDVETPPEPPIPITPLVFAMRDDIGLARPNTQLPLAFAYADLVAFAPVRFRMEAAERLVRKGVLAQGTLFSAYREETPAASGGVWDRSGAVQAFDDAILPEDVAKTLIDLDKQLTKGGLRLALAQQIGARLAAFRPDDVPASAHQTIAELLILSGRPADTWLNAATPDHVTRAAKLRLTSEATEDGQQATEAFGPNLLRALNQATSDDPDDQKNGLSTLANLGLAEDARAIALSRLLAGGGTYASLD